MSNAKPYSADELARFRESSNAHDRDVTTERWLATLAAANQARADAIVGRTKAEMERDEARDWVRRLTAAERTLTCVYCGHAYPPGTPAHGSDVLTAHIEMCEKHPAAGLRRHLEAAEQSARLAMGRVGEAWRQADDVPARRMQPADLLRRGGPWLGAAREWLQWNKRNGSDVTWGSTDEIKPPMTARDVDSLAAHVAAALWPVGAPPAVHDAAKKLTRWNHGEAKGSEFGSPIDCVLVGKEEWNALQQAVEAAAPASPSASTAPDAPGAPAEKG